MPQQNDHLISNFCLVRKRQKESSRNTFYFFCIIIISTLIQCLCVLMPLQLVVPYYFWLQSLSRSKLFTILFSSHQLQTYILLYLHPFEIFELFATSLCTTSLQPSTSLVVHNQHPCDPIDNSSSSLSWGTTVTMLMAVAKMIILCCTPTSISTLRSLRTSHLVRMRLNWRHLLPQQCLCQVPQLSLQLNFYTQFGLLFVMHFQVVFHCQQSYFLFNRLLARWTLTLLLLWSTIDCRLFIRQLSHYADWHIYSTHFHIPFILLFCYLNWQLPISPLKHALQTIVFEPIGNFDIRTYHDFPVDCQTFQLIVVSIWLTDKFRKKQKWLPCALLWILVSFSILMIHWTCLLANIAFISNSRSHEPFLCGLPSIFKDPVLIHWSFYSIDLSCCSNSILQIFFWLRSLR